MRFIPLATQEYIDHRKHLAEALTEESIAIVHSNDEYPSTADQYFPFRQNKDLLRLTGIYQEETALVLFPHHPLEKNREILFIKRNDAKHQTWNGNLFSKEKAKEISGIKNIYWFDEFESIVYPLIPKANVIYLNSNEKANFPQIIDGRDERLGKLLAHQFPFHTIQRLQPILKSQAIIKSPAEIDQIKNSINITGKTWNILQKIIKPGMYEYEVQAEIEYSFAKQNAIPAFPTIVASGSNACTLHYTKNSDLLMKDDLILIDMGAELNGYAADMTRCMAIDGKMSKRQFEIYDQVLNLYSLAESFIKPGKTISEVNEYIQDHTAQALLQLSLIKKDQLQDKSVVLKYMPHGISHFLGMDVHDYGDKYTSLKPNMIISCEPGIYILEEGIGIRLENDLLITENGVENLMQSWEL